MRARSVSSRTRLDTTTTMRIADAESRCVRVGGWGDTCPAPRRSGGRGGQRLLLLQRKSEKREEFFFFSLRLEAPRARGVKEGDTRWLMARARGVVLRVARGLVGFWCGLTSCRLQQRRRRFQSRRGVAWRGVRACVLSRLTANERHCLSVIDGMTGGMMKKPREARRRAGDRMSSYHARCVCVFAGTGSLGGEFFPRDCATAAASCACEICKARHPQKGRKQKKRLCLVLKFGSKLQSFFITSTCHIHTTFQSHHL
jgi:hypothetical protein